jgi:hypothetical protein
MITPLQENARMLAALLGVDEELAAERLSRAVFVTAPDSEPGLALAREVTALLDRTVDIAETAEQAQLELVIASAAPRTSLPRLHADIGADGLMVGDTPVHCRPGAPHALLIAIAACPLAAAVLHRLVDSTALPSFNLPLDFRFEALGIPQGALEMGVTLDDAVLAGAGAVAHGFLRALRHIDVRGRLAIVDPKQIGSGNANRCLYLDPNDRGAKAHILARRAAGDFAGLALDPFVGTFADYVRKAGTPPATAIVTVDSRRVRRSIQKELPGRVLDASTTDVRAVVVHSHRQPTAHACLACIYRHIPDEHARERSIAVGLGIELIDVQQGLISADAAARIKRAHPQIYTQEIEGKAYDTLFKQLCAEQALITPEGKQVLAPFAFVSNLAGGLLVVELLRSNMQRVETNYWTVDPWGVPIARLRRLRPRVAECEFCSIPGVEAIVQDLWGGA